MVQHWTPEHVILVERAKAALAMPVNEEVQKYDGWNEGRGC